MFTSGKTDQGMVRSMNEDSIFVSDARVGELPNLYIVADGMGGCNAGEVASARAIEFFCEHVRQKPVSGGDLLDYIVEAASDANNKLFELSLSDSSLYGMGTTFTACVVADGKLYIAHVGDSRAYSISGAGILQLTTDHSYVNEMYKAGHLTKEQAEFHPKKNLLTRAFGIDENVPVDGIVHSLGRDEFILLCSDGLTNMLSDERIAEIAGSRGRDVTEMLIAAANENGGHDNISAIIIAVDGETR